MTSESFKSVCCFSGALISNQCDVFNIFNWHYQEKNITMVDCALVSKTRSTDAVSAASLELWVLDPLEFDSRAANVLCAQCLNLES